MYKLGYYLSPGMLDAHLRPIYWIPKRETKEPIYISYTYREVPFGDILAIFERSRTPARCGYVK